MHCYKSPEMVTIGQNSSELVATFVRKASFVHVAMTNIAKGCAAL